VARWRTSSTSRLRSPGPPTRREGVLAMLEGRTPVFRGAEPDGASPNMPPGQKGDAVTDGIHYKKPGWFTQNVFNKVIQGLTRSGLSVMGSRVLEVKGERVGLHAALR